MTAAAPSAARTLVPDPALVSASAAFAVAGLAVSSSGSMVVAAVLVGVATRDRWAALAAVLAVASVTVRFGTTDFGDIAGIQSVLGPAGVVGPPAAAGSAWAAAAALVLAAASARRPDAGDAATPPRPTVPPRLVSALTALGGGAFAAAIVAGPGPGGDLAIRVAATAAASVLCAAVGLGSRFPRMSSARAVIAVAAGLAALVLAGWPS